VIYKRHRDMSKNLIFFLTIRYITICRYRKWYIDRYFRYIESSLVVRQRYSVYFIMYYVWVVSKGTYSAELFSWSQVSSAAASVQSDVLA